MVRFSPSGAVTIGREATVPATGRHPAGLTRPGCCLVPVHNAHDRSVFWATGPSPAPGLPVTARVALGVPSVQGTSVAPQPGSCDGLSRASAHPRARRACVTVLTPAPQNVAPSETGVLRIQLVEVKLGWGGAAPIPQDWRPRKGATWTQEQECTWGHGGRDRGDASPGQGTPLAADGPAGARGGEGADSPPGPQEPALPTA